MALYSRIWYTKFPKAIFATGSSSSVPLPSVLSFTASTLRLICLLPKYLNVSPFLLSLILLFLLQYLLQSYQFPLPLLLFIVFISSTFSLLSSSHPTLPLIDLSLSVPKYTYLHWYWTVINDGCIEVHIHTYLHTHTHTHTHIHIYIHTHTHTHTYTYACAHTVSLYKHCVRLNPQALSFRTIGL